MKRKRFLTSLVIVVVVFLMFGGAGVLAQWVSSLAAESANEAADDPDRPAKFHTEIDEPTYLRLRDEYVAMRRGIDPEGRFDPRMRGRAIQEMETEERALEKANSSNAQSLAGISPAAGGVWSPLGPAPLPNGRVQGFANSPVSGRATAVGVDPTNSNIVYLGTAQGGVWRSLDGGTTWTNIFDSAQSLAIGAIAIAPSSPTTVYVGTGEPNQSGDSFFGVGLYRIDNASTTADLVGPINPLVATGIPNTPAFTGRAISSIAVDPSDAGTIWVTTMTGIAGIGATGFGAPTQVPPLGLLGLYKSTNATSALGSI